LNREFMRREWGAIAFLVVTALGIIVVPIGLNINKQPVSAASTVVISLPSPSPAVSASPVVSPGASAAPSASASPSAAASASPTASAAPSPSPS
jgi:hypothetical protein